MPTYVYETIPQRKGEELERFEWRQSMRDEPLRVHPQSGLSVRRVISGGFGLMKVRSRASSSPSAPPANCCPGCHD